MSRRCRRPLPDLKDWRFSVDQRGHRLGDLRPRGRERRTRSAAGRSRNSARSSSAVEEGARDKVDPRPRASCSAKEHGLHRRRRHPRVRPASTTEAEVIEGVQPGDSRCSTASSGCRCRWSPPSTASASAAGSSWRSPATSASPTRDERHPPRLPRGEARHLPRLQRHGALDPPGRRRWPP